MTRANHILEKLDRQMIARFGTKKSKKKLYEVSPPGFKGTIEAMKKHPEIDNVWRLGWWMKKQGYKSHKKADGSPKAESREGADLAYGMYDIGPLGKPYSRRTRELARKRYAEKGI